MCVSALHVYVGAEHVECNPPPIPDPTLQRALIGAAGNTLTAAGFSDYSNLLGVPRFPNTMIVSRAGQDWGGSAREQLVAWGLL